jgi:hypothetical protein
MDGKNYEPRNVSGYKNSATKGEEMDSPLESKERNVVLLYIL